MGRWEHGQLGHGETERRAHLAPRAVAELRGVRLLQIECGAHHTAAVTAGGQLYTWGSGKGCLGQGPGVTRMPVPTQICAND